MLLAHADCSKVPGLHCIVNLGKWILRYLFAGLIDEEIKRDEAHRATINEPALKRAAVAREAPPMSIAIPPMPQWEQSESAINTPKAGGINHPPVTPGLGIGVATPGPFRDATTPATPGEKRTSQVSRPSVEKDDYFSNAISAVDTGVAKAPVTPAEPPTPAVDKEPKTPADGAKDKDKDKDNGKSPTSAFTKKKFRMNMSFGTKKPGRSASSTAAEKPAVVDEKTEEQQSESSSHHEKEVDDCFLGAVQKIRHEYEKELSENPDKPAETRVIPSLPNDTPVLRIPPRTMVILQEETSGGSAELYRGTVEKLGRDTDIIEQKGPLWLGEVLLSNVVPFKEPIKLSFVLHPWQNTLPSLAATDGNNRLNANRMLRVRKILAYVAERIDPPADPENPDPNALKAEEYLELYCQDQVSNDRSPDACGLLANGVPAGAQQHEPSHSPDAYLARGQRHCHVLQSQRQKAHSQPPATNRASC